MPSREGDGISGSSSWRSGTSTPATGSPTLDVPTAQELDKSAVVLCAGGAVAEVLGDGGKGFGHLPAGEFPLDVLGEARERLLAAGVLAGGAEQMRGEVAVAHRAPFCVRCPSRSSRRRSFMRASWSTL